MALSSLRHATPFPSSSSSTKFRQKNAAIKFSRPPSGLALPTDNLKITKQIARQLHKSTVDHDFLNERSFETISHDDRLQPSESFPSRKLVLSTILQAISDRVEMHINIGEQRTNWNALLLNSINMMTFTATTIAGISSASAAVSGNIPIALNIVSSLLFSAVTGMLLVMNKIQPSQLAEEQRNSTRLFKELYNEVEAKLEFATEEDVEEITRRVLALDRAYPLPLLGVMLDKFPAKFEPAVWWPSKPNQGNRDSKQDTSEDDRRGSVTSNGWTKELETEMRAILQVMKQKDLAEYKRLGSMVLRINKTLAIAGPLLTGMAAAASAFVGTGPWAAVLAVAGGALAGAVNSFEHGAQVGMVFEMYRNNAGFFRFLEETIESALEEGDFESRENGELLETKVAIKLGRSLSQLRDLAAKSISSVANGTTVEEFANKLF